MLLKAIDPEIKLSDKSRMKLFQTKFLLATLLLCSNISTPVVAERISDFKTTRLEKLLCCGKYYSVFIELDALVIKKRSGFNCIDDLTPKYFETRIGFKDFRTKKSLVWFGEVIDLQVNVHSSLDDLNVVVVDTELDLPSEVRKIEQELKLEPSKLQRINGADVQKVILALAEKGVKSLERVTYCNGKSVISNPEKISVFFVTQPGEANNVASLLWDIWRDYSQGK